ncbi:MAG: septum formation initiator family protein [Fimbriimonadaceae bacterium]|nr:septum formation initiator family protein [Fimbriimonadaceae bacterium]
MKRPTIVLLTLALAITTGAFLSRAPWQQLKAQKADYAEKVAKTRKIESERAELLQKNAKLESPFGMEERARELGYHKPYEKPMSLDK